MIKRSNLDELLLMRKNLYICHICHINIVQLILPVSNYIASRFSHFLFIFLWSISDISIIDPLSLHKIVYCSCFY